MPMLFTCPHCGVRTQIEDAFIGREGPCHSCGKRVRIEPPRPGTRDETPPPSGASVGVMIAAVLGVLALSIAAVAIVLVFVVPNMQNVNNSRQIARSEANLKQLAAAMQSYHVQYGSYPPPYTVDADGKRMHSWRVLLLPFLDSEARQIYGQLRLDEPWDSQHNLQIAAMSMPSVYRSPSDPAAATGDVANYFVVVGKTTLFPGPNESASLTSTEDALNRTLLIAECVGRNTIWTEPRELEVSRMQFRLNTFSGDDLSGPIEGGVMIVTADGSTYFVKEDTPQDMVEGLTTRAGQDPTPLDLQ